MFEVILEAILGGLIAYGIGYLCGTVPVIAAVALVAFCVTELVADGFAAAPVVVCILAAGFFGVMEKREKAAQEQAAAEKERKRREAVAQLGPAVVPLSDAEVESLAERIYGKYITWCGSEYDHTWVVIAFEAERVRFSAVGAYPPYTGFSEYYPYSHQVFGSTEGMNYDEFTARSNEQRAYRRQVAQRVLSYISSRDTSHLSNSLWIDETGDILSSSQH